MGFFSLRTTGKLMDEIKDLKNDITALKKNIDKTEDTEIKVKLNEQIEEKSKEIEKKEEILMKLEEREITIIILYSTTLLLLFSIVPIFAFDNLESCFLRQLFYIGSAGGLGGVIYSILGFTKHLNNRTFDINKKWWYFFRPLTAVVLGVLSYLFIAGGLMTLSSDTVIPPMDVCLSSKGVMFYCALSFLVGISNNAFVRKLNDLAATLFKNTADDETELQELKSILNEKEKEIIKQQEKNAEFEKRINDLEGNKK